MPPRPRTSTSTTTTTTTTTTTRTLRARSASVSKETAKALASTPSKGRGKRPREADVSENEDEARDEVKDSIAPSTPARRGGRARSKTPATETKEAGGRSNAKKPRVSVSVAPKPLKVGLNPLPTPFPFIDDIPHFQFDYTQPKTLDPRKEGNEPLAMLYTGTANFGEFGQGEEVEEDGFVDEPAEDKVVKRLTAVKQEEASEAKANGDEKATNGHSESSGTSEAGKLPAFGKLGIESVACGGQHTLVIDSNGRIWSWGNNDDAALGRITSRKQADGSEDLAFKELALDTTPRPVEGLDPEEFRAVRVAASDCASVAVSDKGELRTWGWFRGSDGDLGFNDVATVQKRQFTPIALEAFKRTAVVDVACGDHHILTLTSDGHVYAHGAGDNDQLGRKLMFRRLLKGLAPSRLALKNIVRVFAGSFHSFALDKDGKVYAWGANHWAQLGLEEDDGRYEDTVTAPTLVKGVSPDAHGGAKVVSIAAGNHHSVFLFDNGEVHAVGRTAESQVGLGPKHPEIVALKQLAKDNKAKWPEAIEAEKQRILADAQKHGREITEFDAGQEAGAVAAQQYPLPQERIDHIVKVEIPKVKGEESKIVQIAAAGHRTLAVTSKGEVFGWGSNSQGELGLGDDEGDRPRRLTAENIADFKTLLIGAGGAFTLFFGNKAKAAETNGAEH